MKKKRTTKPQKKRSHVETKKKSHPFRKLFILVILLLGVIVLGLHILSSYFFGVSIATLANDALAVSGITSPTVEEIQALPVEQVSANVEEFIRVFNEANPPEPAELEDGMHGLVVVEDGKVILEATIESKDGKILSIDYTGLPAGITDEDILEMDEKTFRLVFGGEIPESLPGALKTYSKSRSGFSE